MPHTIRVWEKPVGKEAYVIGGDPAEGLERGDDSVLQVIRVSTGHQVCEVQGKIDPFSFAELALMVGTWYNTALVAIEANKDGGANRHLMSEGYRNIYFEQVDTGLPYDRITQKLGLTMNMRNRGRLITQARRYLEDKSLIYHSRHLHDQLQTFILQSSKFQAVRGGHDDLVMAWIIACEMFRIANLQANAIELPPLLDGRPAGRASEDLDVAAKLPLVDRLIEQSRQRNRADVVTYSDNLM